MSSSLLQNGIVPTAKYQQCQVGTELTTGTTSVSAGGWADIGTLSVSITPSSATSKILILYTVNLGVSSQFSRTLLLKDSVALIQGDAASSRMRATTEVMIGLIHTHTFSYVDSPGDTSAHTYKVQMGHNQTSSSNVSYNKSNTDTDSTSFPRAISNIIAIELKA